MNWSEKLNRLPKAIVPALLFGLLLLLGVKNYSDYGLSWDEPDQRVIGTISYNYLFHGDDSLKTFRNADYGVGIELPLVMLEKSLQLEDSQQIFQMRHLAMHLFFLVCLFFGYLLVLELFKSIWLAVVAVLFFALNPILYAHSFFNTKDIPFMAMYLVCFYFIYKAFKQYRPVMFLLAGMSAGYLVNLRIMGVLLLFFVVGFIMIDLITKWKEREFRHSALKSLTIFLFAFFITLYITWPYLYEHPIDNLVNAFLNMSKFRWNREVLYFGDLIVANDLPWHYGPVWMAITTPLVYLLLGFTGLALIVWKLLKKPLQIFQNGIERHLFLYILCFIAPFIAVITFKSVLYDGWRHLYFVYPPFVMLAIYGLFKIGETKIQWSVTVAVLATFAAAAWFMVQNHPHQQTYFNVLLNQGKPEQVRHQFELDYWGVSYLEGINAILDMDDSPVIEMQMWSPSGENNLLLLPDSARNRIKLTEENPKYFLTEYRWHPQDYPYSKEQEVYSIKVENNTILSVYKLRD